MAKVSKIKKSIVKSAGGVVVRRTNTGYKVALLYKNGHWVLPKGRIENGESRKRAALREVYEETGIPTNKMKVVKELGNLIYTAHQPVDNYRPRPKIVSFFLINTSHKTIRPLKRENFEKAMWVDLNQAFKKVTFYNNKAIILQAIKYFEKRKLNKVNIIVIAVGGKGKRMNSPESKCPKLLLNLFDQPFLKTMLDLIIASKFKKIILLTSYYDKEIKSFISKCYPNCKEIIVVSNGKLGQKLGVPSILYKKRNLLNEPFIYSDGNIIYQPEILKKLSSAFFDSQSLITLVLSPKNLASTHLQVLVKNKKITDMMIPVKSKRRIKNRDKLLCSMGLMLIDNRIFELLPNLRISDDLDCIIKNIFRKKIDTDQCFIDYIRNDNTWLCIHTKFDLDFINKKGKKFFSSLKNKK